MKIRIVQIIFFFLILLGNRKVNKEAHFFFWSPKAGVRCNIKAHDKD